MITEIFVEGKRLDLTADIASLLTFALDDVKDFSSRSTAFSKTIVLPGTANNNAIFGNIFETGISNDYDSSSDNIGYNFNASKAARCLVFQDNLQTFKGTLRLLEIDKDRSLIEYEVALNGEITSLNVALSSALLEDLDFSEYDDTYDYAAIDASWTKNMTDPGSGVYYPLIDYGNYSVNKHDWDIRTFRPALYVKEYIDKMFAASNFRYECALFNTGRFKRLIVPHNQKVLQGVSGDLLHNTIDTDYTVVTSVGIDDATIQWETVDTSIFTASLSNSRFTYTGTGVSVTIAFQINGRRRSLVTDFHLKVLKNGVEIPAQSLYITSNNGTFWIPFIWFKEFTISIAPGEYLEFLVETTNSLGDTNYALEVSSANWTIVSDSQIVVPIIPSDTVQLNHAIPKNIRQVDFLVGIVKLFNLYVYESQFDERLILIKPFIEFYSGDVDDWTYKLNRDAPIKIKPLSEVNSKIYNFNYRDDSDYFNDLYKKRYNQGYGSHIYDSQFEFASQTNKLEIVFSPTPLVGYVGEDKIYPTIFKRTGPETAPVEENVDSNIRILQSKVIMGVTLWDIMDGVGVYTPNVNSYGYAGHFNDPDNPDNDLNFGLLKELFFILTLGNLGNTQFNVYWSGYMAEITDKDAKMVTARFYLTAKDIFDLNFSRFKWVDGVLYRLNKITDYNVTVPGDCVVELLNVIRQSYLFPPGTPPEGNFLLWDDDEPLDYDDSLEILYQ